MAQFGKRGVASGQPTGSQPAGGVRTSSQPDGTSADLAGAIEAVRTGKMPHWAGFGPGRIAFLMLVVAGISWFLVVPYVGDVLRDNRLAGTWQPAYDMHVVDGKCTRYQMVLTLCNATIKSHAEPDRPAISAQFMMAFAGGGGQQLVAVRSTVDPGQVAIAYGAESVLMNRTLTLLFVAGVFMLIFLIALFDLVRGRYVGGAAHRALLAGLDDLTARAAARPAAPDAAG